MKIETDATTLMSLLKKKKRASATELGTSAALMSELAEAGAVREDGTVKTGTRGRPPAAWVICDDFDGELPDLTPAPVQRRTGEGISQAQIDRALAEIKKSYPDCTCVIKRNSVTLAEIRELGCGCKYPRWVCGALDALRRKLAL